MKTILFSEPLSTPYGRIRAVGHDVGIARTRNALTVAVLDPAGLVVGIAEVPLTCRETLDRTIARMKSGKLRSGCWLDKAMQAAAERAEASAAELKRAQRAARRRARVLVADPAASLTQLAGSCHQEDTSGRTASLNGHK